MTESNETKVDKLVKWFKNNTVSSIIIFILICIIGLATLIESIGSLKDNLFGPKSIFSRLVDQKSELKTALAELAGKKRALAQLFDDDADVINIHSSVGRTRNKDWSPKTLIETLESVIAAQKKASKLLGKNGIHSEINDYSFTSEINKWMTLKQVFHKSLNKKLYNLSLNPPSPEDFKKMAKVLKNEANELDKIANKIQSN